VRLNIAYDGLADSRWVERGPVRFLIRREGNHDYQRHVLTNRWDAILPALEAQAAEGGEAGGAVELRRLPAGAAAMLLPDIEGVARHILAGWEGLALELDLGETPPEGWVIGKDGEVEYSPETAADLFALEARRGIEDGESLFDWVVRESRAIEEYRSRGIRGMEKNSGAGTPGNLEPSAD